jgi:hypothetical protein
MRFSTILSSEQAAILYDLVKANRVILTDKWALGMADGLLTSLADIDRGGGACVRGFPYSWPSSPDHLGLIEAAIIPACSYVAWLGATIVPGVAWWELAGTFPELLVDGLVFRPVTIYRASKPLVLIPIEAAKLPDNCVLQATPIVQILHTSAIPALVSLDSSR